MSLFDYNEDELNLLEVTNFLQDTRLLDGNFELDCDVEDRLIDQDDDNEEKVEEIDQLPYEHDPLHELDAVPMIDSTIDNENIPDVPIDDDYSKEDSLHPSPSDTPGLESVYSNNETIPVDYHPELMQSDMQSSTNNLNSEGVVDDLARDDDMIQFQFNINNTLEQLLKTMKQTELSRLSLNLAQQAFESGHACNRMRAANSNFDRRNSVNSPSLTIFNHMHHNTTLSTNNRFVNPSTRLLKSNPPFKASRRLSVGKSKKYRPALQQNRRSSFIA